MEMGVGEGNAEVGQNEPRLAGERGCRRECEQGQEQEEHTDPKP